MPRAQWKMVDTRLLSSSRDTAFDGFIHILPWKYVSIHQMDMSCWCDTRVLWSEDWQTMLVSHRDMRPEKKKSNAD